MLDYSDWLRIIFICAMAILGIIVIVQVFLWHRDQKNKDFNLQDYFTAADKTGRQRASRPALGELVALFATTSAYLGVMAVKPETFEVATVVYGGLWVLRGSYANYLKSKSK